jgi:high-affinity nickel-transport protein
MQALASLLVLGFVLGLRHATDADHVVAVGAITSRERSLRAALWIGAWWGLGHALTVLVVGGAIVLFGLVIPPRVGLGMEFSVALVLIVLGVLNLRGAVNHLHQTAQGVSEHPVPAPLSATGARASVVQSGALRAVGVGIVHGLAGSASVALLVLASITDARLALLYLAVFGVGTLLGMMTLTSALALPVALAAERFERVHRGLARAAGLFSVAFGLFLAYRIGFVEGLLDAR